VLQSLSLAEWLGVLGFILSVLGLILQGLRFLFDRMKEEKRKPKLSIHLDESMPGHPSEEELGFQIRPDARITNIGELATTISEVRVEGISVRTITEQSMARIKLEEPIRIQGKDAISFKVPIFIRGVFPEEDCYLSLTIYYTKGSAKSNIVISKYYKILPPGFVFKKPMQ